MICNAILRPATPTDVPEVLRLIRALAEYERLLHEATATEDDLRKALFGPLPRVHAVLAEIDRSPVGLALSTLHSVPSRHVQTSFWKTCLSIPHIAAPASA